MQRRKFLKSTLVTAPLVGLGVVFETTEMPASKPFVIRSGKDRFDNPINYQGKHPNLVKLSSKDTDGQLSIFEYEGLDKMGLICTYI